MALQDDFNRLVRLLEQAGVNTRRFREEFERAQTAGEGMDDILENMDARLVTANRSMRGFSNTASDLTGILKANLAELSKSNSAIKDGTKGYRQLSSIVSKLSDSEDGIYQLQVKQLKLLNEKAQVSLKEIQSAANRLVIDRGLHKLSKDQLINATERLVNAGRLTAEEAALLRAKATNFEFETKAAREAEHRLNLEKNITSQLGLTGGVLSSIGKLASKIGLTNFSDELETITTKLQNDMRVQTRKAAEEQLASTNKEYSNAKKLVETYQKRIDAGKKLSDSQRKRLKTAQTILNVNEDIVKTLQEQSLAAGGLGLKLRSIVKSVVAFGKQLLDPMFIVAAMVKNYIALDKAAVDFQRLTGQNARALAGQNNALVTSVEALEQMSNLSKELGFNVNGIFTPQQIGDFTYSVKALGLGAEEAANLGKRLTGNVKNVKQFEKLVDKGADTFTTATGKAVNLGQVLRGVSTTSDAIALSLGQNPERLGEAVASAQALGLSLNRVDQIASSLMDFESSIQNELEAQLLTGGQIALGKARELALNNDLAGLTKEIANNNALSDNFASANRIQQESMAKALGMSRDELAKMIIIQKAQKGLSTEEVARQMRMTPEMVKQITAQQKLNDAVAKLGQSIAPFIDALVPIIDLITPIISGFSEMAAKVSQVGVNIRESLGSAADSDEAKSLGKLLGVVTGGAIAIRGVNRLMRGALGATQSNAMWVRFTGGKNGLTDLFGGKKGRLTRGGKGPRAGQFVGDKVAKRYAQRYGAGAASKRFGTQALKGSKLLSGGSKLLKGSGILSLVGAGMDLVGNLSDAAKDDKKGVGSAIGRTLDQNKFLALGATIGSIVPGLGTAIGAGVGGILDFVNNSLLDGALNVTGEDQQLKTGFRTAMTSIPTGLPGSGLVPFAQGGIVTQPTKGIVGEAGSEAVVPLREFYAKMDEVINVIKQGGNVYIDGNKVGESLMLASTKLA